MFLVIGSRGTVFTSVADLLKGMQRDKNNSAMMVRETDFRLVSTEEKNASGINATVMGTYKLYSSPREQLLHASTQLITICFTLAEDGWKAHHIHVCNKRSDPVSDEVFPLAISQETYQYVREILRTGSKRGLLPSLVMLDGNESARYLNPDDILYIEAEGKRCAVHCLEEFSPSARLSAKWKNSSPDRFCASTAATW